MIQSELSIEHFLHGKGYNYFTIPNLSYKEIQQLLDGEKLATGEY